MPKIISLSGNIGSGKDRIGEDLTEYLQSQGFSVGHFFFAKALKEFCVKYMRLPRSLVFGSQQDKETLTEYKWENMPGVLISNYYNDFTKLEIGEYKSIFITHHPGNMTIREILQFVGTEIFRKIYDSIWIDFLIKEIEESSFDYAIVTDGRFHNELDSLFSFESAFLIRLLRQPDKNWENHESEKQIHTYPKYHVNLDNRSMTLSEQKDAAIEIVKKYFNV